MFGRVRANAIRSALLLREARLRAGLTQSELAERSRVHRVQLNRYEAGAMAPGLDTLVELVRACGFELSLELAAPADGVDERLGALEQLSPEERLERMLRRLPDEES